MKRWAKKQTGFTIVELLIVIVVIGILAAITIVAYNGIQQRAQLAAVQSDVKNVQTKLALFQADNNSYPGSITDCPTPASSNLCLPASGSNYLSYQSRNGPYLAAAPSYELTVFGGKQVYYTSALEVTSSREFLNYTDMAPIIDKYGLVKYQIDFDIKSANVANRNSVSVYMQNGSGSKYAFGVSVPVTTSYVHQTVTITPTVWDGSLSKSMLAFYGIYDSGNIPSVKNVTITRAD